MPIPGWALFKTSAADEEFCRVIAYSFPMRYILGFDGGTNTEAAARLAPQLISTTEAAGN
jgi:hypothetical protein